MKRKDGHYRWQLVRVVPLKDDAGKILKWFGICTDIDGQKRTQPTSPSARAKDERTARNRNRTRLERISPPECCHSPPQGALAYVREGEPLEMASGGG